MPDTHKHIQSHLTSNLYYFQTHLEVFMYCEITVCASKDRIYATDNCFSRQNVTVLHITIVVLGHTYVPISMCGTLCLLASASVRWLYTILFIVQSRTAWLGLCPLHLSQNDLAQQLPKSNIRVCQSHTSLVINDVWKLVQCSDPGLFKSAVSLHRLSGVHIGQKSDL